MRPVGDQGEMLRKFDAAGEFRRRATLMFNGYPAVASLYKGLDLRANY